MISRRGKIDKISIEMAAEAVELMKTFKTIFDVARRQEADGEPVKLEIVIPPLRDPRVPLLGWAIMQDYVERLVGAEPLERLKPIVESMRSQ